MSDEIVARLQDPHKWLIQAAYLKAAGYAVIEKSRDVFRRLSGELDREKRFEIVRSPEMWMTFSGVMLFGFSLENLIKGLLVSRDKSVIGKIGGRLSTPWDGKRGHDLRWLMDKTGIKVTEDEFELLNLLTKAAVWGGRYPAPKSQIEELGMEWSQEKSDVMQKLFAKVRSAYPSDIHGYED